MLKFGTKAETLRSLAGHITNAQILPLSTISLSEWKADKIDLIDVISKQVGLEPWIVRSSSLSEDQQTASNAGALLSLQNINKRNLRTAIGSVFSSYPQETETAEVLVQPMLKKTLMSGVAFSHDPKNGSPDRLISWHEGTNTRIVTGGRATETCRVAPGYKKIKNGRLLSIIKLLEELLILFNEIPLDIEFAITSGKDGEHVWLLQARPLIIQADLVNKETHLKMLRKVECQVRNAVKQDRKVLGTGVLYGVMPDWNPAEIIGTRPRQLALSLYQTLITDEIWAQQRARYGYRDLTNVPLMQCIGGQPFINIRASLSSLIPADINEGLAEKLVRYYSTILIEKPELHDKMEFEVAFTCLTADTRHRLKHLTSCGFSIKELKQLEDSLMHLTNEVLNKRRGLFWQDVSLLHRLSTHRMEANIADDSVTIEKIKTLLDDTRRYGTLPFAGLARSAFIAIQMLNSFVKLGVLSLEDYSNFLASVSTVSSDMQVDKATMRKEAFLLKYGHLRPGTYDVLSHRYDSDPGNYFDWNNDEFNPPSKKKTFTLKNGQIAKIDHLNEMVGISLNCNELFQFIEAAIQFREKAKFEFTKNLSLAMELMKGVCQRHAISVSDLSFCNYNDFHQYAEKDLSLKQVLRDSARNGRQDYNESLKITLPPLIFSPTDVYFFKWPEVFPNFVTQKTVTAKVVSGANKDDIDGKIVCLINADPGYDWIFSKSIVGLITAWGGVNSHMAIRAGELGIPAVIGAGDENFMKWSQASNLSINCAEGWVQVI